jgi:hypothetical protein
MCTRYPSPAEWPAWAFRRCPTAKFGDHLTLLSPVGGGSFTFRSLGGVGRLPVRVVREAYGAGFPSQFAFAMSRVNYDYKDLGAQSISVSNDHCCIGVPNISAL